MKFAALCLALAPALLAQAADADLWSPRRAADRDLLPADSAFRLLSARRDQDTVTVSWSIAAGYYLYKSRLHFAATAPAGVSLQAAVLPPAEHAHDARQGDAEIYRGAVAAQLHWNGPQPPRQLRVNYQGCAEAGFCYPPQTRLVDVVDVTP